MFESTAPEVSVDAWESLLLRQEAVIAQARAIQAEAIRALDAAQVATCDGARSLQEWVAARLDVAPETGGALVRTARTLADCPQLARELAAGEISFDRAAETARLHTAGADPTTLDASRGCDIAGLRRVVAAHRRLTPRQEQDAFAARHLALQPNLDQSSWRLWGQLAAADGHLVDQALTQRGDTLPQLPHREPTTRGQRNADALVAIAQDSLTATAGNGDGATPLISVFVDAALAAPSRGQAGATLPAGPKVGAQVLEEILCTGATEITLTRDGTPLAATPTTRVVSPRLRRWLLRRDHGCTIDGCRSRYRLQPHHIIPYSHGGTTQPDNLTTLCWYHHHVVVHGHGYQLDPTSPPQRRRFLRRQPPRAPP